jgi:hypothetical protein
VNKKGVALGSSKGIARTSVGGEGGRRECEDWGWLGWGGGGGEKKKRYKRKKKNLLCGKKTKKKKKN